MFRKAEEKDLNDIAQIYEKILDKQDKKEASIGWVRGVYPTKDTARAAMESGEMFVYEKDGKVLAAARINQEEVKEYEEASWRYKDVPKNEIMVIHTLVVDPDTAGKGIGKAFIGFYEEYAKEHGCRYLRMDTNQINKAARSLYAGLGYWEADIVDSVFNGIPDVRLVCLEKLLDF